MTVPELGAKIPILTLQVDAYWPIKKYDIAAFCNGYVYDTLQYYCEVGGTFNRLGLHDLAKQLPVMKI